MSVCLELITENVNRLNFTLTAEINLFQEPGNAFKYHIHCICTHAESDNLIPPVTETLYIIVIMFHTDDCLRQTCHIHCICTHAESDNLIPQVTETLYIIMIAFCTELMMIVLDCM